MFSSLFNCNTFVNVVSHLNGPLGTGRSINHQRTALLKGLFENFEREELYKPLNLIKKASAITINEKEIKFREIPYFSLIALKDDDNLRDSSGVAAGINSHMALEHAFLEFIERQSIIYSFLKESAGVNLTNLISDDDILSELNNGVFYINDISIIPNVSVVIIIFSNETGFAIGLGTDYNQKNAALKAYEEALGFNKKLNPHKYKTMSFDKYREEHEHESNVYSSYITTHLSGADVLNSYSFLKDGIHSKKWKSRNEGKIFYDIEIASSFLKIPITVQFLSSEKNWGKIVRVFSEEGYPMLDNTKINPYDYKISFFEEPNPLFVNTGKYLPFP